MVLVMSFSLCCRCKRCRVPGCKLIKGLQSTNVIKVQNGLVKFVVGRSLACVFIEGVKTRNCDHCKHCCPLHEKKALILSIT